MDSYQFAEYSDEGNESFRILIGVCDRRRFLRYAGAVKEAGFSPVFVPEAYDALNRSFQGRLMRCVYADRKFCSVCAEQFDGLLLPGGGDLHPAHFDQIDRYSRGIEVQTDRMQFYLAEAFISAKKPVLGICRGMQLLNVLFGGDLQQELGREQVLHHAYDQEAEKDRMHDSWFDAGFSPARVLMTDTLAKTDTLVTEDALAKVDVLAKEDILIKTDALAKEEETGKLMLRFPVNSAHHQAVGRLGNHLQAVQWADDGVIEGIAHDTLPVVGLQWHPERCGTKGANSIFQAIWKEMFQK
ncbi:MAG: gamma-glutamyl-gamma-aminobutyrate hydrolase family protein [Lachnospiraceae bacterium]|nr:gamma-glutamyl-gamma-aminobutyrate hydrolase family protein [Lachnospiraceae bacterium]